MNFAKALNQIAEIHAQVAKAGVYRGLKSLPVALSGACGFLAAALEPWIIPSAAPLEVVVYWVGVAALSAVVGTSETVFNYVFRDDPFERRNTRRVVGQFLPSLVGGAFVTSGVVGAGEAMVFLLPGLWAVLFGLGILASRPYLPRAIGWVGLFYLGAGFVLLARSWDGSLRSGWEIGATFGCGQLACAVVLYWNLERTEHA